MLNELIELASLIKEMVFAIVPVVTVWIAYQGLNTWRQQLKGTDQYTVGRNYLKSLYDINAFTSHFCLELYESYKALKQKDPQNSYCFMEQAIDNFKDSVESLKSDVILNSREAQVLFGSETALDVEDIFKIINEWIAATMQIKFRILMPEKKFEALELFDELFEFDDDAYSCKFSTKIDQIVAVQESIFAPLYRDQ